MNSFGTIYKTTIFGESHGLQVGVVIDGAPAGIPFSEAMLMPDLDRRRSGRKGTTSRKESDTPRIVSGLFNGYTTGAPITVLFDNENTISSDYRNLITHPRPGHADWVAQQKYKGFADYRGGGHFSGRITLGMVVAGSLAKTILKLQGVCFEADVTQLGEETNPDCFEALIAQTMKDKESIGGIVECRVSGVPVGVGEPFFDSMESVISHAAFSIPGIRGIEFGEGFRAATRRGSQHNDPIVNADGSTGTNHAGGINGGITNGNDIVVRIAVKPTASISTQQYSLNTISGQVEPLIIKGRHDACIALRVPVILESAIAMALLDLLFISKRI